MEPAKDHFNLASIQQQHVRRPRRKPRGRYKGQDDRGRLPWGKGTHQQQPSISSSNTFHPANNNFYPSNTQCAPADPNFPTFAADAYMPPSQPGHTPTSVWKSERLKEQDEFQRNLKKVAYIAPGFVKSGLFPQSFEEWRQFKLGGVQDQLKEKEKDTKEIAARIETAQQIPKQNRTIKSVFGAGGKVFNTRGGPVLAMPTIWSSEHISSGASAADWPTQAELLMHGDNRDMTYVSYRSLPPPRLPPSVPHQPYQTQPILQQFPLDEVEPEFTQGPRYVDYTAENMRNLDESPVFNGEGNAWLGESLTKIIGPKVYRIVAEVEDGKGNKGVDKPEYRPHGPMGSQPLPSITLNAASPTFIPAMGRMHGEMSGFRPTGSDIDGKAEAATHPHRGDGLGDRFGGYVVGAYAGGPNVGTYGYGHQMHDGSYGYPPHDGSSSFVPGPGL